MRFGLLSQRRRWGLTWRGWLVVFLSLAIVSRGVALFVHPFLALTERVETDVLVVEGWVADRTLHAARDEFRSGSYRMIFTTGGPLLRDSGESVGTAAELCALRLCRAGLPAERIQSVPAPATERDRTYGSAVALRDWLRHHHMRITRLNIVTQDAHARRTRLLFQQAFGSGVQIGVIAVSSGTYDPHQWWRNSEGVRDVVGEAISYVYAKFLFFAPATSAPAPAS